MGVLVKRPGDKVKIDPVKFWGSLTTTALFVSMFVYLFGLGGLEAQNLPPGEGPGDDFSDPAPPRSSGNDPNCPEINQGDLIDGEIVTTDPEAGLVAVCGRIVGAALDNTEDSSGMPIHRDTRKSVRGATIAIYEQNPGTINGKTFDGKLMHLFSSTSTNGEGRYRIKMRALGPGSANVYIVVLCNGQYKGGKRINSLKQINNLDVVVNCDSDVDYTYTTPPPSLNIVNREFVQECTTDVLDKMGSGTAQDADYINIPVKFKEPTVLQVTSKMEEENYDFRYVTRSRAMGELGALDGNAIDTFLWGAAFENSEEGALWEEDCRIRNGGNDDDDFEEGDEWVCSSETMDAKYGGKVDAYLLNTALRFIPESPEVLAWRRKDNRASLKQVNTYPFAIQQFMNLAFGNYSTKSPFLRHPLTEDQAKDNIAADPLITCEEIEQSKYVQPFNINAERINSISSTVGPALGLGSPYFIEKIVGAGLIDSELDDEYCVSLEDGVTYTLGQVMEDPILKERLFRAEGGIPTGSGSGPYNSEETKDSVFQNAGSRAVSYESIETEAQDPHNDLSSTVYGEYRNRSASTVSSLFLSGELYKEDNLMGAIFSPYGDSVSDVIPPEDEGVDSPTEVKLVSIGDRPTKVWDLGVYSAGLCSISNVYGEGQDLSDAKLSRSWSQYGVINNFLHNNFLGNPDHINDDNVGSGTIYTADSIKRDEYLSNNPLSDSGWAASRAEFGITQTNMRDPFDSLLEMAAGGNRIDLNVLSGWQIVVEALYSLLPIDGENKSFGEHENFLAPTQLIPRFVYFDLNDENFETVFPAYKHPDYPGGDEENYPWKHLNHGETCNVWPGPGNPDIDWELRTCKLTSCTYYQKKSVKEETTTCKDLYDCEDGVQGDFCGGFGDWAYYCTETEWKEVRSKRPCTSGERRTCLVNQKDNNNCGYNCVDTPPRGGTTFNLTCALDVAGPYQQVGSLEIDMEAEIEQDFKWEGKKIDEPRTAHDVDSMMEAFNRTAKMLGTTYDDTEGHRLNIMDWDITSNPGEDPTFGFDSPGIGIDPDLMWRMAASPTSSTVPYQLNGIVYHCGIIFIDTDDNPRPAPPGLTVNIPGPEYDWDCPVKPFVIKKCDPKLFDNIQKGGNPIPGPWMQDPYNSGAYFEEFVYPRYVDADFRQVEAYGFASGNSGVPCEILAGIHHIEGGSYENQSLLNGSVIDPALLPFDALTAAQTLKGKLGAKDVKEWGYENYVVALDHYNGPGNRNCKDPRTDWCPIPEGSNPPFPGWDHIYPMSWIDSTHTGMFIKYCFDHVLCIDYPPLFDWLPFEKPGVLAIAKLFYQFGE